MIQNLRAQNSKRRFFYVLYSDITWVFDRSERAYGPIYIIEHNKQHSLKAFILVVTLLGLMRSV